MGSQENFVLVISSGMVVEFIIRLDRPQGIGSVKGQRLVAGSPDQLPCAQVLSIKGLESRAVLLSADRCSSVYKHRILPMHTRRDHAATVPTSSAVVTFVQFCQSMPSFTASSKEKFATWTSTCWHLFCTKCFLQQLQSWNLAPS